MVSAGVLKKVFLVLFPICSLLTFASNLIILRLYMHYYCLFNIIVSQDFAKLPRLKPKAAKIDIIDDISGIIKPGRYTYELMILVRLI